MPKTSASNSSGRGDSSRQPIACSECRRRKEKCDRVWPCGQCKKRKVQHDCRFGSMKFSSTKPDSTEPSGLQRKRSLSSSDTSSLGQDTNVEFSNGLTLWGYTTTSDLFNLQTIVNTKVGAFPVIPNPQSMELKNAITVLPNRSLIDKLVQSYVYGANYRYYLIYPPTFLENYSRFWEDKNFGIQVPDPEFTCLLLRVCALSTQHLTDELRAELEEQIGESASVLTKRYHNAAEALHNTFPPGTGGLMRVQQLLVKVTWCKGDGDCIASWHAIKSAVGEAQEIGMDMETFPEALSEFEVEMRRRVWCLLYVWDWQMSMWLGRPLIIEQKRCSFVLPNLRLDESTNNPGLPSPFTHIVLQAELCQDMSRALGEANNTSFEFIKKQQHEFEQWIKKLPPIYSVTNPDTQWDEAFPYIVQQRHQLHTVTFMLKLGALKKWLTCTPNASMTELEHEFRAMGVDTALQLLNATKNLYNFEYPIHSNFHLVVFCFFDTAVTLSSAILHDVKYNLPRRADVLDGIRLSLQTLQKLSGTTTSAPVSHSIVATLVNKFRLAPGEKSPLDVPPESTSKRIKADRVPSSESQRVATPESGDSSHSYGSAVSYDTIPELPASTAEMPPNSNVAAAVVAATAPEVLIAATSSTPQMPPGEVLAYQAVEAAYPNFTGIPMGGMENMIDWGTYHIMPDEFAFAPLDEFAGVPYTPQYPPPPSSGSGGAL